MMQLVATIWKPTKANGGCSAKMKLDKIGVDCAASVCARYHKGISAHGCNAVLVGGVDDIAEYLKIKEATEKGYAEAYEGDGVNFGASGSHTRRGRVQSGGVNTLTTQNEQGVVVYDEQNNCTRKDDTVGSIMTDGNSPKHNNRIGEFSKENSGRLRIRKLTPRECFRLQGWDDEYFDRAKAAGTSDTQLYKQAGNGISVNVAHAIGLMIADIEREENNGKG